MSFNIPRAFEQKIERGWPKLYWLIDLHDTIITGTYKKDNEGYKFFPKALETLKFLSEQPDQVLILWTSSFEESVAKIRAEMTNHGVFFDYWNENPECESTAICDFSKKLYFNILLDDKAGFNGQNDWYVVERNLQAVGLLDAEENWTL